MSECWPAAVVITTTTTFTPALDWLMSTVHPSQLLHPACGHFVLILSPTLTCRCVCPRFAVEFVNIRKPYFVCLLWHDALWDRKRCILFAWDMLIKTKKIASLYGMWVVAVHFRLQICWHIAWGNPRVFPCNLYYISPTVCTDSQRLKCMLQWLSIIV